MPSKAKTTRVTILGGRVITAAGALVREGAAVDLPPDEAAKLIELGHAEEGDKNAASRPEDPPAEPDALAVPDGNG